MPQHDAEIRIATSLDTTDTEKEINKLQAKLDSMREKSNKMEELGQNKGKAFESLTYDIEKAEEKLDGLNQKLYSIMDTLGKSDDGTAQWNNWSKMAEILRKALSDLPEIAKSAVKKTASILKTGMSAAINKVGKAFKSMAQKAKESFKSLFENTKKGNSLMGSFSKRVWGLAKRVFVFSIIAKAFRAMVSGIKEGFTNLCKYSAQTASAMNAFKSQTATLKNNLAAAFAPIANLILPMLTRLISYLNQAANAFGQFIATITGQKTYIKATTQVVDDYSDSVTDSADATSAAAKEEKKSMATFDTINQITTKDDSSSSGGSGSSGGGSGSGGGFETVDIDETDFAKAMKEAIGKQDWEGVGGLLAEKINGLLDGIDWATVNSKCERVAKGIAEGLNGFIAKLDWKLVGSTIGNGLNTAVNTAYTFITTFNFRKFGKGLGDGFNSGVKTIDWKKISATISAGIIGLLDMAAEFIETVDWSAVAVAVEEGLEGVDWAGIVKALFELIGAALGGIAAFVGKLIADGIEASKKYWEKKIDECGGNVVLGIFKGIIDGVKGIAKWLYDNVFTPFIEGFKKAFGIHSPSKVMAQMGTYIIDGFLNGIKATWTNITAFFSSAFKTLKTDIKTAIDGIKGAWDKAWGFFKDIIHTIFGPSTESGTIAYKIATTMALIGDKIDSILNDPKKGIKKIWSTAWETMKSTIISVFDGIKDGIKKPINAILGFIESMVNGVISGLNLMINALNKLKFDVPDWVPAIGGKTFGFSIAELSKVSLPKLAEGSVIPPNRQFAAILGDQTSGVNIETPLATMVQAFKQAISESGTNQQATVVMEVSGREFGRACVKFGNKETQRVGISLID